MLHDEEEEDETKIKQGWTTSSFGHSLAVQGHAGAPWPTAWPLRVKLFEQGSYVGQK